MEIKKRRKNSYKSRKALHLSFGKKKAFNCCSVTKTINTKRCMKTRNANY